MKRIITLFTAAAALLSAYGAHLTPGEALDRVSNGPKAAKAMGFKAQAPQLVMTGTAEGGLTTYYVFSNESGTLFVSADDVAQPLLGYTDTGDFDPQGMPPQLQWWLSEYSREIEWATQLMAQADAKQTQKARKASASMPAIQPMVTTTWDQSSPYNKFCPKIGNELTVTGCVATAMAQVMYYHQWPQSAVAPISYVWKETTTLTSPSVTLDWANMRTSYSNGYTTAQADAVARLMQVAGYSVNMDYGLSSTGGSSAFSSDMRNAIVDKLGYDVGADYIYRDYYGADEWAQIIYDNLKNVGPVVYRGSSESGEGHAFVCDGYNGEGMFHINWGWGGHYDGYFALSALNPDGLGIGGGTGSYNYDQGAVVGIRRPQPGSVAPEAYIYCSGEPVGTMSLRTIVFMSTGDNGGYYSTSYADSPFTYGAKFVNASTNEVTYLTSSIIDKELKPGYGYKRYSVEIPATLADGTYMVYPAYRYNGGEWKLVKIQYDLRKYLTLTINGCYLTLPADENVELSDALMLKSYRINAGFVPEEPFDVTLTILNTYAEDKSMTITARLSKYNPEDNKWYGYATLGTNDVTIPANSQANMQFDGILDKIDIGDYNLVFVQNGYVIGNVPVYVGLSASIDAVEADQEQARYYNIQGIEVRADQLTPGIYIRQSASKTDKVIIR